MAISTEPTGYREPEKRTISNPAQVLSQTEQKLLAYCRQQGLFKPGNRVIVACSGGADSMALLLFLLRCRNLLEIEVMATHVNHGIRGAAADADAVFVADFCQKQGIPFFLYDARREGTSVPPSPGENWARHLRYSWFDTLANREHAQIATAHTLSDQAETLLFRLARGTGLHGMAGIPPKRGPYVRPTLCLTRQETEGYCAALGQSYVQDETNAQDAYARNRIRHDAVPALQYANPTAEEAIGRFCSQMQALDSWLNGAATDLLQRAKTGDGYSVEPLCAAVGPVLDAALHRLISAVRDPEEKYVILLREIVRKRAGALQLTDTVTYRVQNGILLRTAASARQPSSPPGALLAVPRVFVPGVYRLPGGYQLEARVEKYEDFLNNTTFFKKDLTCCADYAKIQKNTMLRTRQPGDVFRPAGRNLEKTLKKLFNEDAVPVEQRSLLPLLAVGSEVVWLYGYGFAQGYAPDAHTGNVLVVSTGK